jgi:thymidylate synthase (FAD)
VLEHSLLVFHITCSRAMLQELARHRLQSLTVKSTRYTLKELLKLPREKTYKDEEFLNFLIETPSQAINNINIQQLRAIWEIYNKGYEKRNDILKYGIPEAYATNLQLSLNFRSFLNLVRLRLSRDALWEFRKVAYKMCKVLPDDWKELLKEDELIEKELIGAKDDLSSRWNNI